MAWLIEKILCFMRKAPHFQTMWSQPPTEILFSLFLGKKIPNTFWKTGQLHNEEQTARGRGHTWAHRVEGAERGSFNRQDQEATGLCLRQSGSFPINRRLHACVRSAGGRGGQVGLSCPPGPFLHPCLSYTHLHASCLESSESQPVGTTTWGSPFRYLHYDSLQ